MLAHAHESVLVVLAISRSSYIRKRELIRYVLILGLSVFPRLLDHLGVIDGQQLREAISFTVADCNGS